MVTPPGAGKVPAPEPGAGRGGIRPVNALLLIPVIGALLPMIYNKDAPRLAGMPFFYWYQFLWIGVSVLVTVIVYRSTRGDR